MVSTREARAKARALRRGLGTYILGTYGEAAVQMLQDFGIPVPKPKGKKTAQAKAEAVVKAKATRAARHTLGKNQKKPIKGEPSKAASSNAPQKS
jgi:hypothetical protein